MFKVIDGTTAGLSAPTSCAGQALRRENNAGEVEGMIAQADKNGDGKVDYAEFMRIVQTGALGAMGGNRPA